VIGDDLPRLLNKQKLSPLFGTEGTLILQKSTAGTEDESARMILPSAMSLEEDGTFINFEGKAQQFKAVVSPFGESLGSGDILARLAQALGLDTGTA